MSATGGHAFISYVREDSDRVDRLQSILEAAGVATWRDTADLWPGEDWRGRIRQAITKNSLVFIACFSSSSAARLTSGQNEELNLAIDQLRLRRPDQPWLIPVRLDDVEIPDLDIGGGRTLHSLQRVDLVGEKWDHGAARLVAGVVRALGRPIDAAVLPTPTATFSTQLKATLRSQDGDIALNDLLMPVAAQVHESVFDPESFPGSAGALRAGDIEAAIYLTDIVERSVDELNPALDAVLTCAQWARLNNYKTLSKFADRLWPKDAGSAGMTVLTDLKWFPILPVLYTAAIAATYEDNFGALKAFAIDSTVKDFTDGRIPVIARAHPWRAFTHFELTAHVLALRAGGEEVSRQTIEHLKTGQRGKRYTPVSDFLHDSLREKFADSLPDLDMYSDSFDRAEVILAALMVDARTNMARERQYFDGPFFGRYTWRDRHVSDTDRLEARILAEARDHGPKFGPVEAGLFGGSSTRATEALEIVSGGALEVRGRRF